MRGDYSAPRDLECVSNRLARSTHDPGTSLTTNTYRYIITRQGSSYRYIAPQLSAFFPHEPCSSLEGNVSLLFRHDAKTVHFPLTRRVSRFDNFLIPIFYFSFNDLPQNSKKKKKNQLHRFFSNSSSHRISLKTDWSLAQDCLAIKLLKRSRSQPKRASTRSRYKVCTVCSSEERKEKGRDSCKGISSARWSKHPDAFRGEQTSGIVFLDVTGVT